MSKHFYNFSLLLIRNFFPDSFDNKSKFLFFIQYFASMFLILDNTYDKVVIAVPRRGRDNLPATHAAVRHDLLHPTMPIAAVSTLKRRLRSSLGTRIK